MPEDAAERDKKTGKDLKAQAKADKAARRARDKQDRGVPQSGPPIAKPSKPPQRRKSSAAQEKVRLPLRPIMPEVDSKKVALFEHLYNPPRRRSIAGAPKDVHPAVLALGLQLSSYKICGSNARCTALLQAFRQVIDAYTTPLGTSLARHLTLHLAAQVDHLISYRPLSISQGNAIRWLKVTVSAIDVSCPEHVAKRDLCSAIDVFIKERITVADHVIAANAPIQDNDVILVYAKSSTVLECLIEARKRGRRFRVLTVDSRPLHEGLQMAKTLVAKGIETEYGEMHSLGQMIRTATKVLLGGHGMMSNGTLYSRVGTAMVALAAHAHKIPVVVCCSSVKFSDRVALDSIVHNELAPTDELADESRGGLQVLNPMFDVTPARYIDMVVSEHGQLSPAAISTVWSMSTGENYK